MSPGPQLGAAASSPAAVRPPDLCTAPLRAILEAAGRPLVLLEERDGRPQILLANEAARAALPPHLASPPEDPSPDQLVTALRGRKELLAPCPAGRRWILVIGATTVESRLAIVTRHWGITRRQSHVLACLARGESNKGIAAALHIAEGTVELHMTTLMRKMGVDSRAALLTAFWTHP